MKGTFLRHKKLFIPLLVLVIIVPILFFARDDIARLVSADEAPDVNIPPITEEEEEEPEEPNESPDPEAEPEGEPVTEPEEEPEKEPEPKPEEKPEAEEKPEPKPEPKPSTTPIIYVGQQLKIPGTSGNSNSGPSKVVQAGTLGSSSKQIALTFDAGWLYEPTIDLLDTLDKYNVKSTFFLRGHWVRDHANLAKEIHRRGHSVENHSLTHGHMRGMTDSQVRNEIIETTNLIRNTVGYRPYLFRPPYGEYDNRILGILGEQGYTHTIMWTIDTHDWADELNGVKVTKQYIVNRVLNNASNRGIVLMHIGGQYTVDALPEMITGLRAAGYQLVKVNDMLPRPGSGSSGETVYTVKKGDTLYSISQRYGVSVDDLIKANGLK